MKTIDNFLLIMLFFSLTTNIRHLYSQTSTYYNFEENKYLTQSCENLYDAEKEFWIVMQPYTTPLIHSAQQGFGPLARRVSPDLSPAELYEGTRVEKPLNKYLKWKQHFEERLYPSGKFKYTANIMMDEIQRLQDLEEKQMPPCILTTNWQNIGPFFTKSNNTTDYTDASNAYFHNSATPGIGRVSTISKHPITNELYLGGANGGLWKSSDMGQTWNDLSANLPIVGTGDIAYSPNGNIMYLATGDKTRDAVNTTIGITMYSLGVLQSTDNGQTWQPLANTVNWDANGDITQQNMMKIKRLLVNNNGELILATSDNVLTLGVDKGLWKYNATTSTWELKQAIGNSTDNVEIADMELLPNNIVIAATTDGNVYRSSDGGNTYSLITVSPTPLNPSFRTVVEFNANASILYIAYVGSSLNGLFKSTDLGNTFTFIGMASGDIASQNFATGGLGDVGTRLGFTTNPTNAEELWMSGSREIYKLTLNTSTNTAMATATTKTDLFNSTSTASYVHPDVQDFEWIGNTLFAAHDGGVSSTNDGGATWTEWYELTSDLCITECLRLGTALNDNSVITTGTYDNGLFRYYTAQSNDNVPFWINIQNGDYNSTVAESYDKIYGTSFLHGRLALFQQNLSLLNFWTKSNKDLPNEQGSGFSYYAFETPLVISTNSNTTLYTGRKNLFKTTDGGSAWTNLTQNITDINNAKKLKLITLAPSNQDIIYISKEHPTLNEPIIYKSLDGGLTWNGVYVNPSLPANQKLPSLYLNQISVHPQNPDDLIAVFSGFNPNEKVYRSLDGGVSWTNISGDLPNLPVNCSAMFLANDGSNLFQLIVGNDVGVYYTNDNLIGCPNGTQWYPLSDNFPRVIIQDLTVLDIAGTQTIRTATFGRGIWETTLQIGNCVCFDCEDPNYPLDASFTLTPEDCLNDPNFDPNGGWQDNVDYTNIIVAQAEAIGSNLTYEWTTDPDEPLNSNPAQYDCEPIAESCKKYQWYVTGLKSVTLTVTDENGCTASHTEYINITSDLTIEECQAMNEFEVVPTVSQPYVICDSQTSICSNNNTGQITLIPNENYIGDINCYTFDLTQNSITIDDMPTYHNDGSISFECLTTGSYRIYAYNEIINCGWQYDATLNPIVIPPEEIVPYQENSYYSVSSGNGDLCEGVAEIVAINGENMATAYHYSFVWDDCNTAECNTYIRTDLCAGLYTITATNSLTGCSYIYEFEIDYRNRLQTFINVVLEGTFVANNTDGLMNTYARQANLIPTEQPYNSPPWDYYGTESVADTFDIPTTAVDWILVEVRHEADTTQIAGRAVGFLLRDGNIIGADGSPLRILNLLENEKYYVIVRHRNHLAISSRNSITLPNTEPTKYDFTTSITQAKGNEQMRELQSGKYAMCAGDANADGMIDTKDYQIYLDESSSINNYLPADFDINTHTTARDFNLMLNNSGAIGIDWIRYE